MRSVIELLTSHVGEVTLKSHAKGNKHIESAVHKDPSSKITSFFGSPKLKSESRTETESETLKEICYVSGFIDKILALNNVKISWKSPGILLFYFCMNPVFALQSGSCGFDIQLVHACHMMTNT